MRAHIAVCRLYIPVPCILLHRLIL